VVGGNAVSGTGTITSTLLSGPENLSLVTASSTMPAGAGSINVTNTPVPGGFTWHTVPGSTGPDFLVDTVVNASAPYLDYYGLAFSINDPNTNAIVGGIAFWANNPADPSTLYTGSLSINGQCYQCYSTGQGTLAASPVPLPAGYALFMGGLGLMGFISRRVKSA